MSEKPRDIRAEQIQAHCELQNCCGCPKEIECAEEEQRQIEEDVEADEAEYDCDY